MLAKPVYKNIRLATVLIASLILGACGGADTDDEDTVTKATPAAPQGAIPATSVGFGAIPALPVSNSNFVADHFSGSGACTVCHNDLQDDTGKDVSIGTAWETSTMANSARDPVSYTHLTLPTIHLV